MRLLFDGEDGAASTIEVYNALRDHHDEIERFANNADEALLIVR